MINLLVYRNNQPRLHNINTIKDVNLDKKRLGHSALASKLA